MNYINNIVASFKNAPIRHKLTVLGMVSTIVTVTIAVFIFILIYLYLNIKQIQRETSVKAAIAGANISSALLFNDQEYANKALSAFQQDPVVISVAAYDSQGSLFTEFSKVPKSGAPPSTRQLPESNSFSGQTYYIHQEILFGQDVIGTIFFQLDLNILLEGIILFLGLSVVILLLSILIGLGLWKKLQIIFTKPISLLADTVSHTASSHDYSIRIPVESKDEMGLLIQGFNQMLEMIEDRDKKLSDYSKNLEAEVSRQTVEIKNALRRIEKEAKELEEANEELTQYAYVVSHDLKTPLRAIHNYADFLREDLEGTLEEEQEEYLHNLGKAVKKSEELVNDLLDYARIGKNQNLSIEPVNMAGMIKSITTNMATDESVEIKMGELPTVDSIEIILRQVFQNLITNALKFNTSEKKIVEIGTSPAEEGWHAVYVRDNGIGIDEQYHKKIFSVFQRLHTDKEFEGTGIGLAIVKKAVDKIHGKVNLESTVGEGTTFTIYIPEKLEQQEVIEDE